ncbi:hypothetical protein [Sphingomonas bisphenolicum]|uniref:Uncharacterized protein n=1 Tax=Sphingomonas bisphenolicum TaxID=296544 RepID=A0ABM7GAD5_9SPHN|nr:hypothetical protein [Sphingomonas bisphenolicum]BBF72051.1 hypothetical protein SBA_ch2_5840 [Sphingomonas bisphenolicum]
MKGINASHPQIWLQDYRKGRVFSITLGYGPDTLMCDGVKTLSMRRTEFAATGKVRLAPFDKARELLAPDNFR